MNKNKWANIIRKIEGDSSPEIVILSDDRPDVGVEICDLPSLSVKAYATSSKQTLKKQKEVRHNLQCASDAIKREWGIIRIPAQKKKKYAFKFR